MHHQTVQYIKVVAPVHPNLANLVSPTTRAGPWAAGNIVDTFWCVYKLLGHDVIRISQGLDMFQNNSFCLEPQ